MIYASEGWQADDRAIYNTLERCRDLGAMLLVHAESSRVLDELIARHHTPELMKQLRRPAARDDPAQLHRGRGDPARDHLGRGDRRPALHRPHVDRARGPTSSRPPRRAGSTSTPRPAPSTSCSTTPCSTGPTATSSPAARRSRRRRTRSGSGRACSDGEVSVVSTDTCTFTRAQKARWEGDWTQDPDGPARPGDAAADRLHPRRARRPAHAGGVRRQVLHQPGQAHGPLSAARA